MKLKLFALVLCTVGSAMSQGMELAKETGIQHIPQDITVGIFHFVDYPSLARSRQVCKNWKTLIDEKLALPQRYSLKYLAQFVQKNNPNRTIKRFEEIFLTPLLNGSLGKTALEGITEELQEDRGETKVQAYQALLNSQLISTCPSITLEICAGKLRTKRELAFPYIPTNLFGQKHRQHVVNQDITLTITGQQGRAQHIFGIDNLSEKVLDRVTEVRFDKINLIKIPRQLQKLSRLIQLSLTDSQLSNIPSKVGRLTKLKRLDLYSNQLSSISAKIGQLTILQRLNLNNNQLSSVPAEIWQLTNLHELYLSNNQLSSISAEIGQLTNLRWLYLHNNQLDSIPAEIGQLTKLQHLYLGNNQLNSILAEISQLTNLEGLYLNNNQLSSIPAEIGQLTNLQRLFLNNNKLNSIPAEIGQLTNLQRLFLNNNQLSNIPVEISQLTNLERLHLSNNQLSSIPAEIKEALSDCYIAI